jgi:hypothetical protein
MTLTIDIPEELETELLDEARRLGLSLPEYALTLLRMRQSTRNLPRTGADLVSYWQREGLIATRPEITDSQAHARQLRQQAERRNS